MQFKKGNVLLGIFLALVVLGVAAAGYLWWQKENGDDWIKYQQVQSEKRQEAEQEIKPAEIDETANWKTFVLGEISFRYPPDWKEPRYIQSQSGPVAEIVNADETGRVIVTTQINKGYTPQEQLNSINKLVDELGSEKVFVDGSEGAINQTFTYEDAKFLAVYIISKDKKSQFSLVLNGFKLQTDKEVEDLLDEILSTFKFL